MLFVLSILSIYRPLQVFNQKKRPVSEVPLLFDENPLTLPDPNTLIKVPYYQLDDRTGHWNEDDEKKYIHSTDPSSSVTFQFNGTQFFIVAYKGRDKCTIKVKIDDIFSISTVNLSASIDDSSSETVFISPNLTFGEHTVRIFYDQPHDSAKIINIAYIYYRPYYNEERLQYKLVDRLDRPPSTCQKTEYESYKAITCPNDDSFTIDFYGTRFWLTGQITNSIEITIDNNQTQTISSHDSHQELGVLVHSSDVLELNNHTVKLKIGNSKIICFFFSQQPYNAISIPAAEMTAYKWKDGPGFYLNTTEFYHETNGNGNTFSFFFYGTRFWAIGFTNPPNEKFELRNSTINDNRLNFIGGFNATGGDALLNKSFSLDYHSLYIKNEPRSPAISKLRLYNIFYINDQNLPISSYNSILFSDTDYDSNWEIYRTDDNYGNHLYSTAINATLNITFVGWKFWLEGFLNPNNGRIEISIDGETKAKFRLYREKHEKSVVYYESPELSLEEHTITLKAMDDTPITFSRLFYSFDEALPSVPQNGLIQVPAGNITRNGHWTFKDGEIYSNISQAEAHYTFNGTKVYLYSNQNKNNGNMEVYIDDTFVAMVNLYLSGDLGKDFISFISDDLPFGQHTITVKHPGSGNKFLSLKKILYRPHLLHSNTVISAYNLQNLGAWTKYYRDNLSYVETRTTQATLPFSFNGTRFWLTGNLYQQNGGKFNVTIDGIGYGPIDTSYPSIPDSSCLLYYSDVLEMKEHTVTITVISENGKNVSICDLIYSQQPRHATIIYPKDMIKANYFNFTRSNLATEFLYRVNTSDGFFQFQYFGTSFWFIGVRRSDCDKYAIFDGGTNLYTSWAYDHPSQTFYCLLYYNASLEYQHHTIKIKSETKVVSKYVFMCYVFYFSEIDPPSEPYYTMYPKDFYYNNDWQEISDDHSDEFSIKSTLGGSKATIKYGGRNFTLEGYLGPCNGMVYIYIDHEYKCNVSLYREEYGYSLFYRSPELPSAMHEVDVVNRNGNPIGLSKIYYKPSPSMFFTDSTWFTNSEDFTQSNVFTETKSFTNSEGFTQTTGFSHSEDFTQSTNFPDSGYFTHSKLFTESNSFSLTGTFSETNTFSKSLSFSSSLNFSNSDDFSESNLLISATFSESLQFTDQTLSPEHQTVKKSDNIITIAVSVVIAILVIGVVIALILIFFFRRRRNRTSEHENAMEANSTNVPLSLMGTTITHNEENDDMNSFSVDFFADQFLHYEEDRND